MNRPVVELQNDADEYCIVYVRTSTSIPCCELCAFLLPAYMYHVLLLLFTDMR